MHRRTPRRALVRPDASASSLPGDASRARQGFHGPMSIEPYPTPEDRLRALAAGQASVLESLAQMQSGALERSRLDRETYPIGTGRSNPRSPGARIGSSRRRDSC